MTPIPRRHGRRCAGGAPGLQSGHRAPRLLAVCAAALLGGCAATPEAPPEELDEVYWPTYPERPRFAYETALRSSADVDPESEEEIMRRLVGGSGRELFRLVKPFAVAARGGRIYVTDTVQRVVNVFDVPRRRFFRFGYRLEGQLTKPLGITVDHAGRVYVADVTARRVVQYDPYGLFMRAFGGPDVLVRPTGVAVSPNGDRVYVIDAGGVDEDRHRVVAYDGEANELFTIGTRGTGPGQFNLPIDGGVGPDGTLYVLDAGNFRVQAFDPQGNFLRAWGGVGSGYGQFARPKTLAVDDQGRVYVGDASFGNIQIFDAEGRLLLPVGRIGRIDRPGAYALLSGLAVDETGRIYAVDQAFNKIEVLRPVAEEEGRRILERQAP